MPGYTELIKNFEKIRDFVRDFFVFGYRNRNDYASVSARSYDNERRRIQSYLDDYISENWDSRGKTISIASDTIDKSVNPLFKVWETKSFTRNDLFLHFVILDILRERCLSAPDIADIISSDYLCKLDAPVSMDAMTVRNKLSEYADLGILTAEKKGKSVCYGLSACDVLNTTSLQDALLFYQNVVPAGFLVSPLVKDQISPFMYRQIFFAQTLDDGVLMQVLKAISLKQSLSVTQEKFGRRIVTQSVVPLQVLSNTRTGRRYLVYFSSRKRKFATMRMDYIKTVAPGEAAPGCDEMRADYRKLSENAFSIIHRQHDLKHIRMVLHIDELQEKYVIERLMREGKHGEVKKIAENTFEYTIDVPDTMEMVPWLRTFIGRIIEIDGTENGVISQFKRDIEAMWRLCAGDVDV